MLLKIQNVIFQQQHLANIWKFYQNTRDGFTLRVIAKLYCAATNPF